MNSYRVGTEKSTRKGTSKALLETRDVRVSFGGVVALDGVDLFLEQGEILGLIGPNGAGKTTLVNVFSGFQRPSSGRVLIDGADVTGWTVHRRTRAGLARTFQTTRLFAQLTVLENVELGALGVKLSSRRARATAWRLLSESELGERAEVPAATLPYGDERRLAILRALAGNPRFILLDEPAAGLDEAESAQLVADLVSIRDRTGCGLLIIEHDMGVVMRLCERIHVLDYGRTISIGSPDQVKTDPAVLEAYLGSGAGAIGAPG